MYEAKILKHSISRRDVELVTFEVNYPHAIHKDIMTHRWARNFQSFRAFPPEKVMEQIQADPFVPEVFQTRVKGMGQGVESPQQELAKSIWAKHVENCLNTARQLNELGLAKAQVNFPIQDLSFIRGIITTTLPQLKNFFGLRLALDPETGEPLARPEVYKIAKMMFYNYVDSSPEPMSEWAWHLPLVTEEEIAECYPEYDPQDPDNWKRHWEYWRRVSVGRCARVSYLTHDGRRNPAADIELHDRLLKNGHMSPFEHQGSPIDPAPWQYEDSDLDQIMRKDTGCFGYGWTQYRKLIPGEADYNELVANG
jgi:hypothetical protein